MLGDVEYLERHSHFGYCRCIQVEEGKSAIRRMHRGRATRSNKFLVEF